MSHLQGYAIEDLEEGQVASFSKTITEADICLFTGLSGDTNPVHLDEDYASQTMFKGRIAHGMLTAALISTVLGTRLPGPGCIYLGQSLKFLAPVRIGDTVVARATVIAVDRERRRVKLSTECVVDEQVVLSGEATLMVPERASQTAAGKAAA